MDHTVLYLGEVDLNGMMYPLCNGMCLDKALSPFCRYLNINIGPGAKHTSLQNIDTQYTMLDFNDPLNLLDHVIGAGMVYHLVHAILEDV